MRQTIRPAVEPVSLSAKRSLVRLPMLGVLERFVRPWNARRISDRLPVTALVRCLAVLLAVGLVLGCQQLLWACPTCKDGLAQNDPLGANLVQGYFWSILFMMSMPFLIISALGGYFYYEVRKARARQVQPAK